MAESQEPYVYTEESLSSLRTSLSERRLTKYMVRAQQDEELALAYYLWNARLSKAMRFPLEIVEVTVRNRIHYALQDRWKGNWPKAAGFLSTAAPKTKDRISEAYGILGNGAPTDKVVAQLSFGFWPAIFSKRYVLELWEERVDRFFPNVPGDSPDEKVRNIRERLKLATELRNRISHLEPIFKRNLSEEHSKLIGLVAFANSSTASWMKAHSTLNHVMRHGPNALIGEPFFLRKAFKEFPRIDQTASAKDASILLARSDRPFLLVDLPDGPAVLSSAEIGKWLSERAADGIVDLDDERVDEMLKSSPPTPVVGRKASLSDLRAAFAEHESRFAVVTESGVRGQQVLAVADLMTMLA